MGVDKKGEEILKSVKFDKFRRELIDSIMLKISQGGATGRNIRHIIEETLEEKKFEDLMEKLMEKIAKETNINERDRHTVASMLLEEEVADEIKQHLGGQVEEKIGVTEKEEEIQKRGEEKRIWKNIGLKRFIGKEQEMLRDILTLVKEQDTIKLTLLSGFTFLLISALLFNSIYKTIVVGLTLTVVPGESFKIKLANIAGAIGGVLIFFISLTLLLEYMVTTRTRDEQIKMLARQYLESRETGSKKRKTIS